ncbi:MAG: flagellar hook-length control protein FliK [Deltaproteobacteria bacterium]|nr:flagellar hook-length control protein FliK [Deltaproteobacteria bacterium]
MEITGSLSISANPVQEGQEVARANREGDDTAAFAALLYLILGTPPAGIISVAPEAVKADETEASASGVVPSQKGSGALSIANGEPNDLRAFLANDISPPPAEAAGAADRAAPTPMLTELGASGAKLDGVLTNGSTPKSAAVADESDASIGGGRAEPKAVSEINRDSIEALAAQASAHGKDLAAVNETARVIRDPAASAPIGVAADAVETDPQAEPGRAPAKFALAEGKVIRRDSVISIEPFDQAQGKPGTRNIEQEATGSSVGRVTAVNIETGPGKVEQPAMAGAIGQVAASGNLSNHVEPELMTEPAGMNHLDLRSGGQFKLDITAGAAGNDSQVHPAQDSEKLTTGTSNPIRLIHGAEKNSTRAAVGSVTEPAGEIHADAELTGKFQFGKTADGGVAEHDARLMAEADTKTDAPHAGRGPAQRLSDIAAPMPRPDIAAEKFGPAGDPAPASWRSTVNRVADELASHVRLNKREAVIQLDPPELGKIKIEMRLDGDKLEARIVAEVHESRELIESHLQELRQALRLHHLDLADVRVSQAGWSGGSGDPMQGFRQQQPDGEPQWARNSENSIAAASASQERSGGGDENGRVSVWA